jgi:hypothetical protein
MIEGSGSIPLTNGSGSATIHDETYTLTAEMKQDKKWRKWRGQS